MKMMLKLSLAALLLSACATVTDAIAPSPESQIAAGANSLTVATTAATVALRNNKITVVQAKNFRAVLGAASTALDDANGVLVKCRTATGSTSATSPDPCKPSVVSIIQLALDSVAAAKRGIDTTK